MLTEVQAETDRVVLAWYRDQRTLAGTHLARSYNVLIDGFMEDHPRSRLRRADVDASVIRLVRAGVLVQDGIALLIAPTIAWTPAAFARGRGVAKEGCL